MSSPAVRPFLWILLLLAAVAVQAAEQPPRESLDLPPMPSRELAAKQGNPILDSSLNRLLRKDPAILAGEDSGLKVEDGRVDVTLILLEKEASAEVRDAVLRLGGDVTAHYEIWIDATVPVPALEDLAALPAVGQIRKPIQVFPLDEPVRSETAAIGSGANVTEGVVASNADDWQIAGLNGSGVSIGILDSFQGAGTAQSLGELPAVSVLGTLNTSSPHGTACAEIIHDMAPGAALTLASPTSATDMAAKIVTLAQSGHDIISSSMGYYNTEPGDGTGPVASAVTTAHDTYGTLYVQAAGNQANYHWDGGFVDGDADGFHEFAPGVEVNQLGLLPSGYPLFFNLRWNAWPVTNQDYDFYLVRWNGSAWVFAAWSENAQTGTQPPTETIFHIASNAFYGLAIFKFSASGGHILDFMGHNAPTLEYKVSDRSLVDPATSPRVLSVAAIDAATFALESYSSWGPTHGPGGILTGGLSKPRISGFANVDTWAYGPNTFNGTSSATPHVAGAAALVLDAFPGFSPAQIATFLETRAVDQGTAGYDFKFGTGRLNLGVPPTVATDFYTVAPCRAVDTRSSTPLASGVSRVFTLAGVCGIPSDARALSVNLTVVNQTGSGNVKLFPADILVSTSSINFALGANRSNNAIVAMSFDGLGQLRAEAFVSGSGTVHLIVDVNGYFR